MEWMLGEMWFPGLIPSPPGRSLAVALEVLNAYGATYVLFGEETVGVSVAVDVEAD